MSRAGILYINPQDLGWNPAVSSWIETRTIPAEKSNLVILFDKYTPACLESVRTRFKKITPLPDMAHIQLLCHLLECLLIPSNTPAVIKSQLVALFLTHYFFGSLIFRIAQKSGMRFISYSVAYGHLEALSFLIKLLTTELSLVSGLSPSSKLSSFLHKVPFLTITLILIINRWCHGLIDYLNLKWMQINHFNLYWFIQLKLFVLDFS